MHFQLISIFPEFFEVLRLSLLGKASQNKVLSWKTWNLRDFTTDPHRSVDDTPYGGGAGMVMRPDIWGKAIDTALTECEQKNPREDTPREDTLEHQHPNPVATSEKPLCEPDASRAVCPRHKTVLAIPTPSGVPLTQKKVRELAKAENIIVACGRYEGIDARVALHYRERTELEVFEYSLGDYVLNGGEIAAVALVEAVGRLIEGTVGNPESLREESFEGGGLLEYPTFTRPANWRELKVPPVLQDGNHAKIEAWRRRHSLERTAQNRPELLYHPDVSLLTKQDREILAGLGWLYLPNPNGKGYKTEKVILRTPKRAEALALCALGSDTFPLACPRFITEGEIAEFTATEFDIEAVKSRLNHPERHRYLVAEIAGELVGYTYLIVGLGEEDARRVGIAPGDAYLSKCYVREKMHGTGLAGALLEATLGQLDAEIPISLGTSIYNKRAQRFYKRHGFKKSGSRKFMVGKHQNQDIVLRRFSAEE